MEEAVLAPRFHAEGDLFAYEPGAQNRGPRRFERMLPFEEANMFFGGVNAVGRPPRAASRRRPTPGVPGVSPLPENGRMPVGIFGVPMDLGQDRRGVDMGPSAIRYARMEAAIEDLGYAVTDLGNARVPIPEPVESDETSATSTPCGTSARRWPGGPRKSSRGGCSRSS